MIHVLLPLDVFRVSYDVAVGRPYSRLEELLLRLISKDQGEEGRTFQELRQAFQVHDRLLIEGLVTLLREGWAAMVQSDQEIRYVATREGLLTISSSRRPASLRVQRRQTSIVRELLSCQLARLSDLEVLRTEEVRRKTNRGSVSFALRGRHHRKTLNGGETEGLLPRNADEQQWIRRIDSNAKLARGKYYLPLRVDLEEGTVLGLPGNWSHLAPLALEETEQQYQDLAVGSDAQERFDRMLKEWEKDRSHVRRSSGSPAPRAELAAMPCAEAALSAGGSRRLAERALERATGHVLIVASQLDDAQAARVTEVAAGLQSRGVSVDVLWSCADAEEGLRKRLANALGSSRGKATPGKIFFNRTPTEAMADFVLAATDDGPVAVLGAGLLSGATQEHTLSPAVLVDDVRGLSTLALLASGWWQESPDDNAELTASRWRHLAEKWVEEAALSRAAPGVEEVEESWDLSTPLLPSPGSGEDGGSSLSLLIGAQGAAARERVMQTDGSATQRLGQPWDPVQVAATAGEWVVGVARQSVSALAFQLRGRLAAELWQQAGDERDRAGSADRLPG
ncbi:MULTISPECIES: hypothetical protein [unclassified Streptomyces]|uniref:hypothetical protein n=1 Tax=unclassified Streptomyces TaxID=2593676 RepID=UPI00225B3BD1|nr:hypothetical protein [Streptomyces sp. NBC_01551]MCX4528570.1 hypothetical protein [Streptomyces sp. NBC_01551]